MNWVVQFEEQNLSLKSQCCYGVGIILTSTASVCGSALAKKVRVKWSPEPALFSPFLLWGRPKGMWLS